jgi:hypothetical protein
MNASAIYSKSGKGVQEAAGKTSHLPRSDRAVLSAIDGRATLADVAQKVGKAFDPAFEKLIETLDKGGFIREVSAGTAAPAPKPAAGGKPAAASARPAGSTAPMDAVSDLDFTASLTPGKSAKPQPPPQAPPRATPPPPKHTATIPPPPPPPSAAEKAKAEKVAKEQQDAFAKAREEAERKAQAERDRVKVEAEAKMRAETEAKLREEAETKALADAEKKLAAEAEAKIKAAREAVVKAAAEAKAKAEAEAKRAREEAERIRKETEEKARREQEELKRKLEEERKAREEAERKAKEEARRLEEERKKLEEERKRREEEQRREDEERAARRKREEEEEKERRRKKREEEEEQERKEAAERAERKKREQEEEERERAERRKREAEEEARERAEKEGRRKAKEQEQAQEEEQPKAKPRKEKEKEPEAAKPAGGGFSDSLLADLESFTNRDEEERKEKEEAERKAKEEAARRAREADERRAKEEAEREEREGKERRKREEAERKAKEEAELREREEREKERLREEEEKRKQEAEEREKKAKQEERVAAGATRGPATYDAEAGLRAKREREMAAKPRTAGAAPRIERKGWGKPIAITLFLLLVVALGVAHIMPIDTADYERAATDALGRPVRIASANLSLLTGLQLKFSGVAIGDDLKIAEVRAYPGIDALLGPNKAFSRIEIEGMKVDQRAVGEALFAKVKADNFSVAKVVAKRLELVGPLAVPKGLDVEINYDGEGAVRSAVVRGPEALIAKLTPKGSSTEVDMSASSFTLPFAPEITLARFSMKGTATPQGLSVSEWDGALLNGTLSGTASVRWGDTWLVDGVVTARSINAAVFAPALLSEGKGEGSGKFSMRGQPGKLASSGRLDGSFTVSRGVLGSIDLSRAIQTGGKQATGRTQFNEMNGQAVYDRGAVSLRNVTLNAGQLNAGASADIAQNGALSGRIVADVRVASQTLRATLNLGGSVKEPQVRN